MKKNILIILLIILILLPCTSFPNRAEERFMCELYSDMERQETQAPVAEATPSARASVEASIEPSAMPASSGAPTPTWTAQPEDTPVAEATPSAQASEEAGIEPSAMPESSEAPTPTWTAQPEDTPVAETTPSAQASEEAGIEPSATPESSEAPTPTWTAQPEGMEDEGVLPVVEDDMPDDENSEQECIYITIPSRIEMTGEAARERSFNISVRGFDTLSSAAVVNVSVSSKNHFFLQGDENALAYGLYCGGMDYSLENASVAASFSNDGTREMTLTIHDELPQSGQYTDTLTFTFDLVRGDRENA